MKVSRQSRISIILSSVIFVLVAATIYVSAASRLGAPPVVNAIDVENPAQVREALLFDPFKPDQVTEAPSDNAQQVESLRSGIGQTAAAAEKVDIVTDVEAETSALAGEPAGTPLASADVPMAGHTGRTLAEASPWRMRGRLSEAASENKGKPKPSKPTPKGGGGLKLGPLALIGGGLGIAAAIAIPIAVSNNQSSSRSP